LASLQHQVLTDPNKLPMHVNHVIVNQCCGEMHHIW